MYIRHIDNFMSKIYFKLVLINRMHSTNKFYLSKYIFWKKQNILRWIELVLCTASLVLAIILYNKPIHATTRTVLLVVTASFLYITFVDVISWCQMRPMGYKTWIMFAIGAFHMFWLCGGMLLFVQGQSLQRTIESAYALYFSTGAVYLLDCLWVIVEYIARHRRLMVAPLKGFTDRAVSTCYLFENLECERPPTKRRISRLPIVVKPRNIVTVSYGGTFPVSKDQTPLPSPDTSRSSFSTAQSWKKSSIPISSRSETYRKEYGPVSRKESVDEYKSGELVPTSDSVSVIKPVRPTSWTSTFYDPFNARLSQPSTAQTLSRISEGNSKDSLQSGYGDNPRDQRFQRSRNRGEQACDCPLVTCSGCSEQLQRPQKKNEAEDGSSTTVLEEPVMLPGEKTISSHQYDQYLCKICGKSHYPYYNCWKCTLSKKDEEKQKMSNELPLKNRLAGLQEVEPTRLESEYCSQYCSPFVGKRNGLDPDDQTKSRRNCRRFSGPTLSKEFKNVQQSSTSTNLIQITETSTNMDRPFTESKAVEAVPRQIDEEVMAIRGTIDRPVQTVKPIVKKDAEIQTNKAEQATAPATVPKQTEVTPVVPPSEYYYLPNLEDPVIHLNFKQKEKPPPECSDVLEPAASPNVEPDGVDGEKVDKGGDETLEKELPAPEAERLSTQERFCYKPCHHPPMCPICFVERKEQEEKSRLRKSETGVNTEPKRRRSLFGRKHK